MTTRYAVWAPSPGLDAELVSAGVWWDAVRMPAYLGDRVLARLGAESGAVIRDPYAHRLYWLVAPGGAAGWSFPDVSFVQVLGAGCRVTVPPRDRVRYPGPHWAVPTTRAQVLTDARLLHVALDTVIEATLGPRPGNAT